MLKVKLNVDKRSHTLNHISSSFLGVKLNWLTKHDTFNNNNNNNKKLCHYVCSVVLVCNFCLNNAAYAHFGNYE